MTSIGDRAFYGCRGLISVTSKIKEPFTIDYWVFTVESSATLYVPRGTKAKYEATEGWKNFKTIIETDFKDEPQGDVNGDSKVDVADIASVIDVMAKGDNDKAADVNGDGKVDVADIATVIDIMAASARELKIEN